MKKLKTAMETLEFMIDSARNGLGCHGASTEGHYVTTVKEKKNGRKKGFYARNADVVVNGPGGFGSYHHGDVIEYVQFFPKGDVDNFSLRMVFGHKDLTPGYVSHDEMAKHTSIEAWMALTEGNVMYGAYNMDTIKEALDYKSGDPVEKRFVKELENCIVNAIKKGRAEIHRRLYGK